MNDIPPDAPRHRSALASEALKASEIAEEAIEEARKALHTLASLKYAYEGRHSVMKGLAAVDDLYTLGKDVRLFLETLAFNLKDKAES